MIKRILVGVGIVTVLGYLVFGRGVGSYIATSLGWARDSIRDQVPMSFEIDRARKMVADLVPDIKKNMHVIAKEEVEIERLESQIAQSETRLEKDRTELMRLKGDLASGKNVFQYAGRSYSADHVKTDLANRFTRFQTNDATLVSLREVHSARQRSFDAARQKLEGMLVAKRQLEVDVENLEARLKAVEVAQTASECNFDDSQLSRTKELVSDLRTRLDIAEKLVNAETSYHDEIPLEDPAPADIVDRVSQYFGEGTKVAEAKTAETH